MYGQPLSWFQRLMQRFQPTPTEIAQAELREAEVAKLHAHSEAEYAALRTQMHELTVEYHAGRIKRLERFLGLETVDDTFMAGEPPPDDYFKGFGMDAKIPDHAIVMTQYPG